ncbi:MAG: metal-dependent hydrolase [Pseudomonadota bacterium]
MPTIFTHPAVPLAIGLGLGSGVISRRLLLAGVAASVIPDLDVLAFSFGVPYTSTFGHRGLSHSISFALLLALLGLLAHRALHARRLSAFVFVWVAAVSHGVLDSFTNGGRGIAFLWPWSDERFFAPVRMIEVSPIGADFFSARGITVLASEFAWVWLPCAAAGIGLAIWRRYR